jgi:hypothetical protein
MLRGASLRGAMHTRTARRIISRRNACQIVSAGWVEQHDISRFQISEAK